MDEMKELKSQAYDHLAQIEFCQGQLRLINQKIEQLMKPSSLPLKENKNEKTNTDSSNS